MGTRADFYVGKGKDAEWLGSVAWDGYEWEEKPNCRLMEAATEDDFRKAVKAIAAKREDWTAPEQGWPWPWEDSNITDMVYAFYHGKTHVITKKMEWPNMKDRMNVVWDKRSGLMIIQGP